MSTPRRSVGLAEVTLADSAYVLNLTRIEDQQSPYVFEGVAFEIWKRIDGATTEAAIVEELAGAADVEREVVERDTRAFLSTLLSLDLIKGEEQRPV